MTQEGTVLTATVAGTNTVNRDHDGIDPGSD